MECFKVKLKRPFFCLGSENDDYYIVEAVNQLMFQNGSWVPYPGIE